MNFENILQKCTTMKKFKIILIVKLITCYKKLIIN